MDVSSAWWAGTLVAIAILLSFDLLVTGRQKTVPTTRQAALWVGFYCSAALVFCVLVTARFGAEYGGQFLAGWLTEYSLSVDNLFVFLVLMARFGVPERLQLRVLTIGIVLALVLRGVLILVGAAAITRFSWLFLIFGAFLIWTAWGLMRGEGEKAGDGHAVPVPDGAPPTPEDSRVVRLMERVLPTTKQWHGAHLTARINGRRVVTPMLLTLVAIGFTDVLFALDSIPAIFGLTKEPFLVVTANAFALMGLRQLFFLVGGLLDRLIYLNVGLSLVLAFIGVKLIMEALHLNELPFINGGEHIDAVPEIPISVSLGVVLGTLVVTAVVSLVVSRRRARAADAERELSGARR